MHVNGIAQFDLSSGSISLTTPAGLPGVIAYSNDNTRRDIIFRDDGFALLAGTSSSMPAIEEGIFIENGGEVGIGTVTPTYRLDVNGTLRCTALTETSDVRLKTRISTLRNSLAKISQLRGVSFAWKNNTEDETEIGLIAQEIEKVVPELVNSDDEGYKSVEYSKLTALLIEAVKELKAENDGLKERIQALEAR